MNVIVHLIAGRRKVAPRLGFPIDGSQGLQALLPGRKIKSFKFAGHDYTPFRLRRRISPAVCTLVAS
jgi:hypothetical protein